MSRFATVFVYVAVALVVASAAAILTLVLTGGYGATLAIGLVTAVVAFVVARKAFPRSSTSGHLGWAAATFLLGGIPVLWLAWKASDASPGGGDASPVLFVYDETSSVLPDRTGGQFKYRLVNQSASPILDVSSGVRSRLGEARVRLSGFASLGPDQAENIVAATGALPEFMINDPGGSADAGNLAYWAEFTDSDGRRWGSCLDSRSP